MSLQQVLGAMIGTGMAGRSMRGPGFGSMGIGIPGMAGMGGLGPLAGGMAMGGARPLGLSRGVGLAALGALAFKAYRDYQASQQGSGSRQPEPQRGASRSAGGQSGGGSSLGDRLGGLIGQRLETGEAPEEVVEDKKALLLIRGMIAAANADGTIDETERRHMLDQLRQAGAGQDDIELLEREMDRPVALDALLSQVDSSDEAEMFYLTSRLAMGEQSPAERSYLQYLASRLSLDPARVAELDRLSDVPAPDQSPRA